MKRIIQIFVAFLLLTTLTSNAATDNRRELPPTFKKSYIGLSLGYLNVPFSNRDLENGFTANEIDLPHFAPRIFVGHFFNPYIALQASLMRPIYWVKFKGIQHPSDQHTVWISLFGITLRPTLPLSPRFSLYANTGLGLISRHGFKINNTFAVENDIIPNFLVGGGATYAFSRHWHVELGVSYTPENRHEKQPGIFYAYTGFYYLLYPDRSAKDHSYSNRYYFPLNFIEGGFFTDDLFYFRANKYVSEGYLPIFWDGKIKNRNGVYLMYERNFFHTDRTFSLEWGASIARYQTRETNQTYYALSVFPEFKVWIVRGKYVDFYFTYSIAGPTYLSKTCLDHIDAGEHFIFQDWLGFGLFLGREKHFNINVKVGHYSNGNLFPNNAGIEVPFTIGLGYSFS